MGAGEELLKRAGTVVSAWSHFGGARRLALGRNGSNTLGFSQACAHLNPPTDGRGRGSDEESGDGGDGCSAPGGPAPPVRCREEQMPWALGAICGEALDTLNPELNPKPRKPLRWVRARI